MDYSRLLNKPVLVSTVSWKAIDNVNTVIASLPFPTTFRNNYLANIPFDSSALFRAKMRAYLQVSGTPMHQGLCLAAAVPYGYPVPGHPNQLLSAPHAFLNANESTSVSVELPFYCPTTFLQSGSQTDGSTFSDFDYVTLVIFVMNPLVPAVGAVADVTISIHVEFTDMDFYVPQNAKCTWSPRFIDSIKHIPTAFFDRVAAGTKNFVGDVIDTSREAIRAWTGFHNPNDAVLGPKNITSFRNFLNNVDQPSHIEKLDLFSQHDRLYDDFYFQTDKDEMCLTNILKKPMYIGTCKISTTDVAGKNLMAYPISPMIEIKGGTLLDNTYYSPLRTLYELTRYWRGSLKLHIQSVMSNFHYCKVLLLKDYSWNNQLFESYPNYADIKNMLTDTIEFSGGGQIQTIDLPYCALSPQLENTKDYKLNAIQHGMMYLYLVQPLVTNGSVSTSINLNFYISAGDDFMFYGYPTDSVQRIDQPAFSMKTDPGTGELQKFSPRSETILASNDQTEMLNSVENKLPNTLIASDFQPIVNIRDLCRKFYQLQTFHFDINDLPQYAEVTHFDVANLVFGPESTAHPLNVLRSMYYGYRGGLKFKFRITGACSASIKYVPPSSFSFGPASYHVASANVISPDPTIFEEWRSKERRINPEDPSCCPYIDMPNYVRPYSTVNATIPPAGQNYETFSNEFELEFVIPNMGFFNFFADSGLLTGQSTSATGNMGSLLLSFTPSSNSGHESTIQDIFVTPFVAFTDEARLGFQVWNPIKTIRAVYSSVRPTIPLRDGIYYQDLAPYDLGIPLTTQTFAPVVRCPAAYFFSS